MKIRWPIARLDRDGWLKVAGGAASVVVAIVLFTRFSIDGALSRDEAIYVYGGQQLYHGVAPYQSIFDPKGPVATLICGLGASLGHLFGYSDVLTIRALFFICSVLAVLAMYLLVLQVWKSVVGALAAAVIMASYSGFARDALPGPDAKTPGVLFLIVCMWLAFRRNWFWAGIFGSLAFLVWQPFLIFPVVAVLAAVVGDREHRLRALATSVAGVLAPIAATFVYFAAAGAFGRFVESTFEYPLTGVKRAPNETVDSRFHHIIKIVHKYYEFSGVLFWIGAFLLLAILVGIIWSRRADWRTALADPVVIVVGLSGLFEFGYALTDFQSYPDVFPLLAFPAVGIGGAVALAERHATMPAFRQAVVAATSAAAALLFLLSAYWFTNTSANNTFYRNERAVGCAFQRAVVPGTSLYSLGTPVPLVVTGWRNPDRYIYLDAGVDSWKVNHLRGGLTAWEEQIHRANPSLVVLEAWKGKYRKPLWRWLVTQGYKRWFLGPIRVFATPEARYWAISKGVFLTPARTRWPTRPDGGRFAVQACGIG
jgi:hypothetical protein